MDFGKRIPKDHKPGADGLWGWESPGLKARLEAEKHAAKPKTVQGDMSVSTWSNIPMQNRDLPKGTPWAASGEPKQHCPMTTEQDVFEKWLDFERPSGDADQVQRAWTEVRDQWLEDYLVAPPAAESTCYNISQVFNWRNNIMRCCHCGVEL